MKHTMKRSLSLVLALCMVLGLVVLPGVTEAKAEGESLLSTPVYNEEMEALNGGTGITTKTAPVGWTSSNTRYGNIGNCKLMQHADGTNYYNMVSSTSNSYDTWIYYPLSGEEAPGANAVLKYSMKVNHGDVTGSWSLGIPAFASQSGGRTLSIYVKSTDTAGTYKITGGSTEIICYQDVWYEVELLVVNGKWTLKLTSDTQGTQTATGSNAVNNSYVQMGYLKKTVAGVAVSVDDLEVYTYVEGAELSAAQDAYTVGMNETISNIWSKTAGAYLPSITFTSSNEDVATVDANGVVTTHSFGEATITATPAASSGMEAVSIAVTVENPNDLSSEPVYTNAMDVRNSEYVPQGWARGGQFSYASKIVTDEETGRTYYHMERWAENTTTGAADSYAAYNNSTAYGPSVLKFDLMVNTECSTWTVYPPIFAASNKARTISFTINQNSKINGETVVTGKWYTCELVYEGPTSGKWTVYIDGSRYNSGTASGNLTYMNMANSKDGGNSGTNKSGATIYGLGVGMCIDNLEVYNYVADAALTAASDNYEVAVGSKVLPVWTKTDGAYLPSVEYSSSNEAIATVDKNGVVTGIKDGEVTITATPAASSGMKPATTTVVVGEGTPEFKISGATLTLENSLAIRFNAKEELFTIHGYSDPYVVFNFNGQETTVTEYTRTGDGKFAFQFSGIAPHQMGETVTATLYATLDGETVTSEPVDYSVLTYCNNKFGVNTELDTLLADLLNYGAAAQTHLGETENLVNATVNQSLATVAKPDMESDLDQNVAVVENPAATWKSATLVLENAITVRLKFEAESVEGLKVQFQAAGATWTTTDFVAAGDNTYYVYFNGLHAGQMREIINATVYRGNNAVSNTLAYSIETYAYKMQAVEEKALGELVIRMMKYGDSASNFN